MTRSEAESIKLDDLIIDKKGRKWKVYRVYESLTGTTWVDIKVFKLRRSFGITEFAFLDGFRKQ